MRIISYILFFFIAFIISANAAKIKLGIDVLIESNFEQFKGKKVGLLTNQSGRTSDGTLSAEVMIKSSACNLVAIFVPEHGLYGAIPAGAKVDNETFMNVPVYSLYGTSRTPNPKHFQNIDLIAVDIQDIGVRSYTYLSTMFYMIKAAAEHNIPIYILDRPNPLSGNVVDGNVLEKGRESFVGIIKVPYVHGCTFGELAKMIVGEGWLGKTKKGKNIKADVNVIRMQNWSRDMTFEDTELMWFPTSPHIPTVDAVRGAAALGIFGELGIINIGIGTTLPFQYVGSPKFKADEVFNDLQNINNAYGISFFKSQFKPFYAKYNNELCQGLLLKFNRDYPFMPYKAGALLFQVIKKHHPELFKKTNLAKNSKDMFIKVTGTDDYFDQLFEDDNSDFINLYDRGIAKFKSMRKKYLLY